MVPFILQGQTSQSTKLVQTRRAENRFKKTTGQNPMHADVESIIRGAGFGGLLDMPFIKIDNAQITALVERWRPETHTFHLAEGEATVTLQDVKVLTGLPVDAAPVTGHIPAPSEVGPLCLHLLGSMPVEPQAGKSCYKISIER